MGFPKVWQMLLNKAEKSDLTALQTTVAGKADASALTTVSQAVDQLRTDVEEGLGGSDVPVGSIVYLAASSAPDGYLVCNGASVSRSTYPELFAAIGTTYGPGNGADTFALPDLLGKVAWGSESVGQDLEAGLPNIEGSLGRTSGDSGIVDSKNLINTTGAFSVGSTAWNSHANTSSGSKEVTERLDFKASDSNDIYGKSETVQPPALTLLPCIKAFGTAVEEGTVSVESLAADVADLGTKLMPVGAIIHTASTQPPAGYLVCDGSAVSRSTYPDLYAVIGTIYGAGDGSTTFNLPNLIGKVAWGSSSVGQVLEAGLPNIEGSSPNVFCGVTSGYPTDGAMQWQRISSRNYSVGSGSDNGWANLTLDASGSSPIYGNSDTVQPPALTLLPCIKAFGEATDVGTVDVMSLATDVASVSSRRYIVERSGTSDGTWQWTIYSDGWIEQRGWFNNGSNVRNLVHEWVLPFEMEYGRYAVTASAYRESDGGNCCCILGGFGQSSLGITTQFYGSGTADVVQHCYLKVEGWMKEKPNV